MGWGGKRNKSGRPTIEKLRVPFSARLSDICFEKIEVERKKKGLSRGEFLDSLMNGEQLMTAPMEPEQGTKATEVPSNIDWIKNLF